MKRIVIFLAVVVSMVVVAGSWAEAPDAEQVGRQIAKRFKKVKDISADFKYTSYIKILDERRIDTGRLYMKKPDQFRIELEYLQLISDGNIVWNYTPENSQALKSKLSQSPEIPRINDILFNFDKTYRIERLRTEKKKYYILTLVPLKEVEGITELDVWIGRKDLLPYKVRYGDPDGNEREYTLSNIKINRGVAPEKFIFQVPHGVEVFETF